MAFIPDAGDAPKKEAEAAPPTPPPTPAAPKPEPAAPSAGPIPTEPPAVPPVPTAPLTSTPGIPQSTATHYKRSVLVLQYAKYVKLHELLTYMFLI